MLKLRLHPRLPAPPRLLATLLALWLLLVAPLTPLQPAGARADPFALPDFGSSADRIMSRTEQRQLGQEFMKWVRKSLSITPDPVLTDYIETLGRELTTAAGITGQYQFFLIDNPAINAFAGPDGHIGVFSGLVLAAQTEGELAAVLAHEIAHVSQNHLLRAFEARRQMALPTLAMMLAAAVLGATVDSQVGAAAMVGAQGAALQAQINFTRANEQEADRIGIETLARAGHDPFAMPGFFQRMATASRGLDSGAPEFLRTHPVTTNRIADAMARAERYGHRQRPDRLRFHLARANLRQRSYHRAETAVDHFQETLDRRRFRNETAERYGHALALTRAGRLPAALEQAERLLTQHPAQIEFIVLKAEIDRRAGRAERAVADLRGAVGLDPANWPLNQAYAEALLAAGRPADALGALERFVVHRADLPGIYELMADAAHQSGQAAQTHRYRAEYLARTGDLEPAIRQLELALRVPDIDYFLASRIEVRLEQLRAEERQQKERG
ncbi:MAG: M48 family peptidase [Chromatiaceae bacterium]|nr:MAG: M48 family peptidase [Chromatiaceae bacterium]